MIIIFKFIVAACSIVQTTQSPEAAKLIVRYMKSQNDYKGAIKFMLIAKLPEEAFSLAQNQNEMEVFAQVVPLCNMSITVVI